MAVNEHDLESIDAYLDGEASEGLLARLSAEPDLAAAIADAEAARSVRAQVWASIEPTDYENDEFYWGVRRAMTQSKRSSMWSVWRTATFSSAAAACVLFGFMVGRVGQTTPVGPTGVLRPTVVSAKQSVLTPITDENGGVLMQEFRSPAEAVQFQQDYQNTLRAPRPTAESKVKLASHDENF